MDTKLDKAIGLGPCGPMIVSAQDAQDTMKVAETILEADDSKRMVQVNGECVKQERKM